MLQNHIAAKGVEVSKIYGLHTEIMVETIKMIEIMVGLEEAMIKVIIVVQL